MERRPDERISDRAFYALRMRPFRFGYQARGGTPDELRDQARRAEAAGFDVIYTFDHLDPGGRPTLPLLTMAEATTTLRVCPLVINNDFHHPVLLAAGVRQPRPPHRWTGGTGHRCRALVHRVRRDGAAVRPAGGAQGAHGRGGRDPAPPVRRRDGHVRRASTTTCTTSRTMRSMQDRLPILVGVNGTAALAHAARHADIIGLMMLGRTLARRASPRGALAGRPPRCDRGAHPGATKSRRRGTRTRWCRWSTSPTTARRRSANSSRVSTASRSTTQPPHRSSRSARTTRSPRTSCAAASDGASATSRCAPSTPSTRHRTLRAADART